MKQPAPLPLTLLLFAIPVFLTFLAGCGRVEVRKGLVAGEKVVVADNHGMEKNTLIAPRNFSY
ncbi:MAG: hypothetical protein NTW71_08730 [Deltaproteobacteria bacterium]|nr:hypothetical protein [Deltaproteobacteria bacterium]